LIAACRSPPAGTERVAAEAIEAEMKRIRREMNVVVIRGETLPVAAQFWEIDICAPVDYLQF